MTCVGGRQGSHAGAAAVVALLSSSHLHVAWLGDCQAVLCRAGSAVRVVNPHKPERPVSWRHGPERRAQ